MIDRRSLLWLFALLPAGLEPAASEDWDGYGERFRRRRRRHRYGHRHLQDHEFARRALQEGRARPLADILAIAKDNIRGEVIGVELEERAGAMVYELKVLRPNGELVELYLDALTAAVLKDDD
ncbi:MAG: PepSY domain-containing protein [Rhodoplanes sp.]